MKQERRGLRGHLGRGEGEEWEADGSMVPAEEQGPELETRIQCRKDCESEMEGGNLGRGLGA